MAAKTEALISDVFFIPRPPLLVVGSDGDEMLARGMNVQYEECAGQITRKRMASLGEISNVQPNGFVDAARHLALQ